MLNTEPIYNRGSSARANFVNLDSVARLVANQLSDSVTAEHRDKELVELQHHLVIFAKEQARDLPHYGELQLRLGKMLEQRVWDVEVRVQIAEEYANFWRKDLLQRQLTDLVPGCKMELYSILPVDLVTDLLWALEKNAWAELPASDFILDVAHPMLKCGDVESEKINASCQILFQQYARVEAFFA